ncbi:MAG TPA: hypothetical protein VFE68_18130 [Vicinamibacteria bacterium]|nr:hypothetical protein [Vicinamibacteria bacterium]
MKRIASLIVVLTAPASAWAQSAPESSHPAGYYVGYLIGIGFAIYAVSRLFVGKKKT